MEASKRKDHLTAEKQERKPTFKQTKQKTSSYNNGCEKNKKIYKSNGKLI